MQEIRPTGIRAHVRYLSDDLLEGRDTGAAGGRLAARYIAAHFEQLGLKPAGDDGTYYQQVPFVRTRLDAARTRITLSGEVSPVELEYGRDFLLAGRGSGSLSLEAPVVFAGYGITAPEFQHNDYQGLDVKGKLVAVLAGEPPSSDPALFDGTKETRHAGEGSKLSLAKARGAAGLVILLHGDSGAAFPWDRVQRFQTRERFGLRSQDSLPMLLMRDAGAERLFADAPQDWESLCRAAKSGAVRPRPLAVRARVTVAADETPVPDANVAALLEGGDPALKKQVVVYTAHYDHVGRRQGDGDTIYNGAWDNASGTAAILEIARAYTALQPRPKRSILFLLVTGEEKGLLGSRYYVRRPFIPIRDTAANINLDMTDIFGIPKEFVPLGAEHSSLRETAEVVARAMGMKIGAEPMPELNVWRRSDQFSFVEAGVPALFLWWGGEYEDLDRETAKARFRQKMDTIYHRVTDEFDPTWSWAGMRRHAQVAFLLGLHTANQSRMPAWKPDSPHNRPREAPVN